MNYLRSFALVATLGLLAGGCASVASDPESTTRFESVPAGANCVVSNDKGFRQEFATPKTMTMHRDVAPVSIVCTAEGHAPANETIQMTTDGWIAGNLLLGGVIGIAIDAASGAGTKFPPVVSVLLDPNEFQNFKQRDQWYERRKEKIEAHFKQELTDTLSLNECKGRALDCNEMLSALDARKARELKRLEIARDTATIGDTAAAIPLGQSGSCLVQVATNSWEPRDCPARKDNTPNTAGTPPTKVIIDGKETCLTRTGTGTWKSGPCPEKPRTTEIVVDGRKQCLVELEKGLWKSQPC